MSHSTWNLRLKWPPLKNVYLGQYLLITSQLYKLVKNVQLSRIGSRPHAFQQAIDEVRMLPITPLIGGSKANLSYFVNEIQVQSNKVCYKVSLCENFQRRSCSRTIRIVVKSSKFKCKSKSKSKSKSLPPESKSKSKSSYCKSKAKSKSRSQK